jgi:hypothetical protein
MILVCTLWGHGAWGSGKAGSKRTSQSNTNPILVEIEDNNIVIQGKTCNKTTKFIDQELIDFAPQQKQNDTKSKTYKIQWTVNDKQEDYIVLQIRKIIYNTFETKIYKNKNVSPDRYFKLEQIAQDDARQYKAELQITGNNEERIYQFQYLTEQKIDYAYHYNEQQSQITNLEKAKEKINLFAKSYDNGDSAVIHNILKQVVDNLKVTETTKPAVSLKPQRII